ncbi:MAG: polysaccharide deacetylase family protein [Bdellovibrionota bacterium]
MRATFFMLGWVAERSPQIVRELESGGHEIGSHGYNHQPFDWTDPKALKQTVKSVAILSSQTNAPA